MICEENHSLMLIFESFGQRIERAEDEREKQENDCKRHERWRRESRSGENFVIKENDRVTKVNNDAFGDKMAGTGKSLRFRDKCGRCRLLNSNVMGGNRRVVRTVVHDIYLHSISRFGRDRGNW